MPGLLVFNPDHEYALANGGRFYQPPASIVRLRQQFELLPIIWAQKTDFILKEGNSVYSVELKRNVECNPSILDCISHIEPWGWNKALTQKMLALGCSPTLMPKAEYIENIRQLTHRRISIKFNSYLSSPSIPKEIFDVEEALEFVDHFPGCYFKMPWSSGGRGVVATEELSKTQIYEWVSGCIKKQHSVLAEIKVDRILDFASLWNIEDKQVNFEGFSISISDGRGKYKGNLLADQNVISDLIKSKSKFFNKEITNLQKKFIEKEIAPYYSGRLGVDMMIDSNQTIHPCGEVNLRSTMGHVALQIFKLKNKCPEEILKYNLPLIRF